MERLVISTLALLAGSTCFATPNRIIGGSETTIDKYPSIVQVDGVNPLFGSWTQTCGGSILNNFYILSAAHCFSGPSYDPSQRRIRAGSSNRNRGGVTSYVTRAINHPTYGALGFDGDITVVRLSSSLLYSHVIQQAKIPSQGSIIEDNNFVTYAGWGPYRAGGDPSEHLRHVRVMTVSYDICHERYSALENSSVVTKNMICAGMFDYNGDGACEGDAGGPLYFNDIVVGVYSWGANCGNVTLPGVNTAVSSYTNWIASVAV